MFDITAIGRIRHLCEVDRQLYISDTIWSVHDPFPILNIVVPHSPQVPRVADLPFFIVTCWEFWISRLSRHFRQYPVIKLSFRFRTSGCVGGFLLRAGSIIPSRWSTCTIGTH